VAALSRFRTDAALARDHILVEVSEFVFPLFIPLRAASISRKEAGV